MPELFVGQIEKCRRAEVRPLRSMGIVLAFDARMGYEVLGLQSQRNAVILGYSGHIQEELRFPAEARRLQQPNCFLLGLPAAPHCSSDVGDFFAGRI